MVSVIGKQYTAAYEIFMKIAEDADERDELTKARAYNGVGDALLGADRTREALLAYLRVRVLYFKAVEEQPRALFGAAKCFTVLRRANEARELVSLLEKEYPKSIWTAMARKDLSD